MEALVLTLIPSLEGQTTLIYLTSCIFVLFFGSMLYSLIFNLFDVFRN